jgi:hypothetical protein
MTGVALRLLRISPESLPADAMEAVAIARRYAEEEAHDEYTSRGLLFDLREQWVGPHTALVGSADDPASPAYQPVLGGAFFGKTTTEVVVLLTADKVAAVADYLRGLDIPAVVAANLVAVEQVTYVVPGEIESLLDKLRELYALAAAGGDAVVKVALS